jgi:hypothetical protein
VDGPARPLSRGRGTTVSAPNPNPNRDCGHWVGDEVSAFGCPGCAGRDEQRDVFDAGGDFVGTFRSIVERQGRGKNEREWWSWHFRAGRKS